MGADDARRRRTGGRRASRPPAFGDVMGGLTTAGAIAAALVKRERTGEPSVVDVSLLATAMWQLSPMVIASKLFGFSKIPQGDRGVSSNPGVGTYRTSDERYIALILLQSRQALGRLRHAAREARDGHRPAVRRLRGPCREQRRVHRPDGRGASRASRSRTGSEAFDGFDGVWSPFQTLDELYDDPQVIANGYLPVDDGRQRRRDPARRQPRPVRRGGRSRSPAPPSTASTPSCCSWTSATTGTRSPP